jgi:competence protein ComGF
MPETEITYNQTCNEFEQLWEQIYSIPELLVFDARLYPSYIVIDLLQIRKNEKRKGKGTHILNLVISFAKRHEKDILLLIDESLGTPKDVLFSFYSKLGFMLNEKYDSKEWTDYLILEHKQINL